MRDNFEFDDVVCQSLDIFCLLRKLGNASKQLKSAGFNIYKQFVVAAIVSKTEVDKEDYRFIVEPRNTLEYLSTSSNVEKVVPCTSANACKLFGRVAIILNLEEPTNIHGEARLLDPNGDLRKQLELINNPCMCDQTGILRRMKEKYFQEFGFHEPYLFFIFSYYIPCTTKAHNCAKLLQLFTDTLVECNQYIILSYEDVYHGTDEAEALRVLRKIPNLIVIRPELFIEKKVESDLDTYLRPYDDVEPCYSRRMLSRLRHRKIKTPRTEYKSGKPRHRLKINKHHIYTFSAEYDYNVPIDDETIFSLIE